MDSITPLERIVWVLAVSGIAVALCAILILVWYHVLCWVSGVCRPYDSHSDAPFWISGVLTGIIERFFFSVAVAFNLSGVAIAMVMWTLLEAQSHWQLFTASKGGPEPIVGIKEVYLGILTSLTSMFLATLVGYYCSGKPWVWF